MRFRYIVLVVFMAVCALGGGASRPDVLSLLYLRPIALICLAALLLSPGSREVRSIRVPLMLLAALAAIMLLQLVPLPPELWLNLPGRARYAEAAAALGIDQPWRPLSLTPDLTLNSLLALLPAAVAFVGFAAIRSEQRRRLVLVLLCLVGVDALLSMLQFSGGAGSGAYFYAVTNNGDPVGLFSNRNHHAMFLTLGFPMLAAWLHQPSRGHEQARARFWVAIAAAIFLIVAILAAGSRAGVLLGAASILLSLPLLPRSRSGGNPRRRLLTVAGIGLIPVLLVLLTIVANRAPSLQHLVGAPLITDERAQALPTVLAMVRQFAPWGIGFGAFDPVYRGFEPDSLLEPEYLNHAHNDLAELVLTGGIPALIVLAVFGIWVFWVGIRPLFRRGTDGDRTFRLLGLAIILILLAACLADYPLRTPLMSVVFAIACGWLALPAQAQANADGELRRGRRDARRKWIALLRIGAVLLGTCTGLWISLGVTASFALTPLAAAPVSRWWPIDAQVQAALAVAAMNNPNDPAAVEAAVTHARAALMREPVNVEAARTLGLVAALRGDMPRAQRLVRYSEQLSRRDVPTQLWLIEDGVQRNDIPDALHHYDRALRTSPGSQGILFPILIQAAESPDIARALAQVLAHRPSWWQDFVRQMVVTERSADAIEVAIRAVRPDPGAADERELLSAAIAREIQIGGNANALRLYTHFSGRAAALVRNGDFETENRFPPLDWLVADHDDFSAFVGMRPGSGSGQALMVVSRNGASGEVARQMLLLPPGQYRLGLAAGDIRGAEAERPKISILCNPSNAPLLDAALAEAPPSGTTQTFAVNVPATGCAAQWLVLTVEGSSNDAGNTSWIDNVSISR